MFEPTTFEQRMQRHEVRLRRRELSRLDMMCFRLDSAAQWLEIKWSRAQPEDLRLLGAVFELTGRPLPPEGVSFVAQVGHKHLGAMRKSRA